MAKAYLTQEEATKFIRQFWTVEDLIVLAELEGGNGDTWGLHQRDDKTDFCDTRKFWKLQASLNQIMKQCKEKYDDYVPNRIIVCHGINPVGNNLVVSLTQLYSKESEPQNILTRKPTTWYKEGHFNC